MIYKEMLVLLKLKISQILLYDTEAALEFLQEYNEIVENEDSLGDHIIQRIEELRINSIQLSLEEFETRFVELKSNYEVGIEKYSFKDREKIEREIYALQASLTMRQVAQGKTTDELKQAITEQDKTGK